MKLEKELVNAKARVKVIEVQEELEKSKTLNSGLNFGSHIGFTKNSSFRDRTGNNMQSISKNMNVLQLFDKNITRVKDALMHLVHLCRYGNLSISFSSHKNNMPKVLYYGTVYFLLGLRMRKFIVYWIQISKCWKKTRLWTKENWHS